MKPPANQLHHKIYLITYLLSVPNGTRGWTALSNARMPFSFNVLS